MISRQLLRKPLSRLLRPARRFQSSSKETETRTRVTRILDRVPRSLRPYAARLRSAPLSHLISFLILHELTAVVPLVGLAAGFHWGGWMPTFVTNSEWVAPAVGPAIEKFGRYFRRKGWFGLGDEPGVERSDADIGDGATAASNRSSQSVGMGHIQEREQAQAQDQGQIAQKWNFNSPGTRIVVEVAVAYAITKALLPLRLMLSVWATPWFARAVVGRVWTLGRGGAVAGTTAAAGGGVESAAAATKNAAKGVGKDIPKT